MVAFDQRIGDVGLMVRPLAPSSAAIAYPEAEQAERALVRHGLLVKLPAGEREAQMATMEAKAPRHRAVAMILAGIAVLVAQPLREREITLFAAAQVDGARRPIAVPTLAAIP